MKSILNKEKIWNQYLDYLREWVYNHSKIEYFGDIPMTFQEMKFKFADSKLYFLGVGFFQIFLHY